MTAGVNANTWRYVAILSGVTVAGPPVQLPNGVLVSGADGYQAGVLSSLFEHTMHPAAPFGQPWIHSIHVTGMPVECLLTTTIEVPGARGFDAKLVERVFETTLTSLRLAKRGIVKISLVAGWNSGRIRDLLARREDGCCEIPSKEVANSNCCRQLGGLEAPYGPPLDGPVYNVKPNTYTQVTTMFPLVERVVDESPIGRSIALFNISYDTWQFKLHRTIGANTEIRAQFAGEWYRLVILWMALEALFTSRDERRIGPTVARRAREFVSWDEGDVLDLWDARSDIIHGATGVKDGDRLIKAANGAEALVRSSLKRAVHDPQSLNAIRQLKLEPLDRNRSRL